MNGLKVKKEATEEVEETNEAEVEDMDSEEEDDDEFGFNDDEFDEIFRRSDRTSSHSNVGVDAEANAPSVIADRDADCDVSHR